MGMDPFYLLAERFPWLDTVEDIAAQQGFFHWELQLRPGLRRRRLRPPARKPTVGPPRREEASS